MSRINVAVLRGGPSSEYDVSLASGAAIIENLPEEKYNVRDILISRDGTWHSRGLPVNPGRALTDVDVAFIGLHGEYGEDGTVQKILEKHGIPYTGTNALGSSIAIDKGHTRERLGRIPGIRMPAYFVLHEDDVNGDFKEVAHAIFAQFGPPYIVKPLRGGSSVGITIAHSILDLEIAMIDAFAYTDAIIVEQFVQGREATCGVLENLRDEEQYSLPPVEIRIPKGKTVFDYDAKYDGETEEICPGNFTSDEKGRMQNAAREIHKILGLNHYSRSDFIIAPSGIYFLEVNTLPGLTPSSLLPKALEAVGMSFPDFLDHVIQLARNKEKYEKEN